MNFEFLCFCSEYGRLFIQYSDLGPGENTNSTNGKNSKDCNNSKHGDKGKNGIQAQPTIKT